MFAIMQNYRILASLHHNALNSSFAFTKPGIDDIKLVDKLYRMEARKNWTDFVPLPPFSKTKPSVRW